MKNLWNWLRRLFGFKRQEENPVITTDIETKTGNIKEVEKLFQEIVWFESCGKGLRQVMKPIKNNTQYIIGLPSSLFQERDDYRTSQKANLVKDYLESYEIIKKSNEETENKQLSANITKEYCGEDCNRCKTLYHGGYNEGIVEGMVRSVSALNSFFRNNKKTGVDIDCQLGIKDDNSDIDVRYNGNLYEGIIKNKQTGGIPIKIEHRNEQVIEGGIDNAD